MNGGSNGQRLVCPLDEELIDGIHNTELIIQVADPGDVVKARDLANRSRNKLGVVRLSVDGDLADLDVRPEWQDIPLAIACSGGLGNFRTLRGRLAALRALNARFYFSLDRPAICSEVRILASLGIATVLAFGEREPDWDALAELMVYALLGPAPHAPVGPFDYYREHYSPTSRTNIACVYFSDPERMLHLDRSGRVALTPADLAAGRFVCDDLSGLEGLVADPEYQRAVNAWRDVFLSLEGCGSCPVWPVCMGRCRTITPDHSRCQAFFKELDDVLHQQHARNRGATSRWRY